MSVQVYVKNSHKEKFLLEVIKAYQDLYPAKFEFYRTALAELRKVTVTKSVDLKGRETRVSMRVPTEPFLFIQSLHPDFGKDSDDITLLCKLWEDMAIASKDHRRRTRLA